MCELAGLSARCRAKVDDEFDLFQWQGADDVISGDVLYGEQALVVAGQVGYLLVRCYLEDVEVGVFVEFDVVIGKEFGEVVGGGLQDVGDGVGAWAAVGGFADVGRGFGVVVFQPAFD